VADRNALAQETERAILPIAIDDATAAATRWRANNVDDEYVVDDARSLNSDHDR